MPLDHSEPTPGKITKAQARAIGASNAWTALDSFHEGGDYPGWEAAYWAYQENFVDTVEGYGGKETHIRAASDEYDHEWEKAGYDPRRAWDIY